MARDRLVYCNEGELIYYAEGETNNFEPGLFGYEFEIYYLTDQKPFRNWLKPKPTIIGDDVSEVFETIARKILYE